MNVRCCFMCVTLLSPRGLGRGGGWRGSLSCVCPQLLSLVHSGGMAWSHTLPTHRPTVETTEDGGGRGGAAGGHGPPAPRGKIHIHIESHQETRVSRSLCLRAEAKHHCPGNTLTPPPAPYAIYLPIKGRRRLSPPPPSFSIHVYHQKAAAPPSHSPSPPKTTHPKPLNQTKQVAVTFDIAGRRVIVEADPNDPYAALPPTPTPTHTPGFDPALDVAHGLSEGAARRLGGRGEEEGAGAFQPMTTTTHHGASQLSGRAKEVRGVWVGGFAKCLLCCWA